MLRMTTSRESYQWWFFPFLFSLLGVQFQIHSFSGDPWGPLFLLPIAQPVCGPFPRPNGRGGGGWAPGPPALGTLSPCPVVEERRGGEGGGDGRGRWREGRKEGRGEGREEETAGERKEGKREGRVTNIHPKSKGRKCTNAGNDFVILSKNP